MVAYGERRMDETPLVARALAGDEAAVAALYDRYADKLYDYARFLTGSSTDAGDITHDVFLVAMQRLSQLRDHAKFRPWVYAIMRTEVSRRRLRASRLHLGAWDDNSGEPVSSDLTPTRAAEIAELRQLIAAAADGLSDDDREVLDLHLRHGLSGAEMAAALEIPERHVSVTMQRLRGRLARGLGVVLVGRAPTCPEFVALRDREGEFSELARKRLARHIDGCVLCSADRDDRMRPEVLLGALARWRWPRWPCAAAPCPPPSRRWPAPEGCLHQPRPPACAGCTTGSHTAGSEEGVRLAIAALTGRHTHRRRRGW
jgi:RNA polymerase sigma factor (sigma-70 family)